MTRGSTRPPIEMISAEGFDGRLRSNHIDVSETDLETPAAEDVRAHIVLVACASSKQSGSHRARDLYRSQLYSASRMFAEMRGTSWYILSALHEVLEPHDVIEPYELTLNGMRITDRRRWAQRVNETLLRLLPASCAVTILAGRNYYEFVAPVLREHGFVVYLPLARLRIGEQVQWLRRQCEAEASTSTG